MEQELLNEILELFRKKGIASVDGYNKFQYVSEQVNSVIILREKGTEATIPYSKISLGIRSYIKDPKMYLDGPSALRDIGITHITSPIYALLHLIPRSKYQEASL